MKSSVKVSMEPHAKEGSAAAAADDDDDTQTSGDQTLDHQQQQRGRQLYSRKYRFDNETEKQKESTEWLKSCLRLRNLVLAVLVAVCVLNSVQIYFYKSELSALQAKARKAESLFRNVFNKDLSQISTNDVLSTFSKVS